MWTKIFKAFIEGHYCIASAAMGTFWQTYFLLYPTTIKPTSTTMALSGLIFFMTLGIYNLHSIVGIRFLKKIPKNFSPRFAFIENYPAFFYSNLILSSLGSIFCLFFIPYYKFYTLVPALILGIMYTFPILGNWRLRDLSFLKVFLVGFVWAWITVYFPLVNQIEDYYKFCIPFIERFLFIFAITLPFDIRDIAIDQLEKVNTITHSLGKHYTIFISCFLLAIWSISASLYYDNIILLLGGIIIAFLVFRLLYIPIKENYFSIILDGSILVLAIIIVLLAYYSIIYK